MMMMMMNFICTLYFKIYVVNLIFKTEYFVVVHCRGCLYSVTLKNTFLNMATKGDRNM